MIKESIKELINAIAEGDTLAIEDSFNTVMASKISDRLDSMRVDVAQDMFGSVEESVFDDARKKQADDEKRGVDPDKEYKLRMKSAQNTQRVKKALTKEEFYLEDYSVEELEDFIMSEEFEQLDELSKKTLGSYVKKATSDVGLAGFVKGTTVNDHSRSKDYDDAATMNKKRKMGIAKAVDKLTKESIDEESNPTGVKIYHTDKSGKAGSHIVFTSQDANRLHSQIKKAGGKVTHHALMFGTKEGEKKPLSEEVEYMSESDKAIKRLKKEYDTHMNKYNAAPFGSQEAAMHNKNAEKVMDKINIHREMSK